MLPKNLRNRRYITLFEGIRPYRRAWLRRDVVAGITLAALAIPEVMAYTEIAGMPVITGLYTMLIPVVAFAVFGSSRHLVVGADSATAAVMYAGIAALGMSSVQPASPEWVSLAGLSALLAGGLLWLARVARLGFLADFLSRTVLIGFLAGVGFQVAAGQIGGMLGIPKKRADSAFFSGDLTKLVKTLADVDAASWQTALVSAATLAVLVVFGRWVKVVPAGLAAVVGMIALSWTLEFQAHDIAVLGPVPSGFPSIGLPSGVSWTDAVRLLPTALSMFFVILAQSAATSRAYADKYGDRFEENTDLFGLGLANVTAGFTGTFVVNGSPTKTEMVDEAKSRTQVAQLTTAAVVAIVLLLLTEPLQYLPNAVLSTVVFLIGLKLIAVNSLRKVYALRRDEFWVAVLTTVVVVMVGVEQGIVLAMFLSLVAHVRRHYAPHDTVLTWDERGQMKLTKAAPGRTTEPGLVIYRFGVGIFYANAARLSAEVMSLVTVPDPPRWLVLEADAIDDVDYTGAQTLLELADRLKQRGIVFAVAAANEDVRRQLDHFGLTEKIGADHYFTTALEARDAYRAQ
ncbi:high affinity sulfate transporter 1 [Kribbella amoyensis]|uniref:High affinity sulfate transporter 1 n=1 Tax=Kribbella amoyensis TaxID=996641 RepID=A0A561BJU8_9ACTN|nr:SulP family inorganic anion transporter [Kribbella amoyensis]TWD79105.1 high affinity sulfate transporter 1 [Kribbella amoyensis]